MSNEQSRTAITVRTAAVLAVVIVALLVHASLAELAGLWSDQDSVSYAYGYLVALIAAALFWRRLAHGKGIPAQPDLRAAPVFLLLAAIWLATKMAGVRVLELAMLPLLLASAIWLASGFAAAKSTAAGWAYLWFAMPLWGFLNPILQALTVQASKFLLSLAGIPAYFDGNLVRIPAGTFEIEGGCSGLNFFMVALSLAFLLGELRNNPTGRRVLLLVLAGSIAMAANWVRVFIVVLAGHASHMQHALVADSHLGFGWLVFAVSMILFLFLESRMPVREVSAPTSQLKPGRATERPGLALATLAGLALACLGITLWHVLARRPYAGEWTTASPDMPPGWEVAGDPVDDWLPEMIGVDAHQVNRWAAPGAGSVDIYRGLFRSQSQGKEFGAYGNSLQGRGPAEGFTYNISFEVDDRLFSSPVLAQLAYAAIALSRVHSPPSIVQVTRTPCVPDCESAHHNLRAWELIK